MVTLVVPGRVVICNTVGVAFSYFIILGVKSKSKTKIVIMEEIKGEMSLVKALCRSVGSTPPDPVG